MRLEGFKKMKNSNDIIGNRTRDLSAFTAMPEPTALPPFSFNTHLNIILQTTARCFSDSFPSHIPIKIFWVGISAAIANASECNSRREMAPCFVLRAQQN
jgi:hypothetical protein